MALRVVESSLNIFVERSLGESRKDSTSTRQFIEQQIKEYEARLNASEERLKEFKRRNLSMLPGSGQDFYANRKAVAQQLEEARLLLDEAMHRRDELRRQMEGGGGDLGMGLAPLPGPSKFSGPFSERIRKLEQQLDNLRLQYTEQHPDVIALKELIDRLETQNEEALTDQQAQSPAQDLSAVQQQSFNVLKVTLSEAEAQVAGLQARVNSFQEKAAELDKRIDEALNVERELKALDRDYGVNKRNYDELVKRREALRIADDAEKSTDQVQFNIVEPPREPFNPSSPNRVLLSSGALVVGLGAGIALAFALSLVRPAFYSRSDLVSVTDLPVLGSVSRILTPEEKVHRRLGYAAFMGSAVVLLAAYGILVTLHSMHVNLMEKVQGLVA
jgi:polysaccharide chain length determinant protein (PEP-CTERM system associated)